MTWMSGVPFGKRVNAVVRDRDEREVDVGDVGDFVLGLVEKLDVGARLSTGPRPHALEPPPERSGDRCCYRHRFRVLFDELFDELLLVFELELLDEFELVLLDEFELELPEELKLVLLDELELVLLEEFELELLDELELELLDEFELELPADASCV
jgi:hypothetical protein